MLSFYYFINIKQNSVDWQWFIGYSLTIDYLSEIMVIVVFFR